MNNFVLIVVITFFALLASEEVTEVCMIGWSKGIGAWAQVIGSVFTVLAMLTTYWSISLALSSIVEEQLKLNTRICWLLATLASLVLAMLNMGGFMEFMRLAGCLISILVAVTVVPAFRNAEKDIPGSLLGKHTGIGIQILVVVAYVLMGVGSVVTI